MTFLAVLAVLLLLAALAPRYGADSRDLRDPDYRMRELHPGGLPGPATRHLG